MRAARSYLYVPGDDSRKLAKATQRGADALIVDLEDAVAAQAKAAARAAAGEFVGSIASKEHAQIWVRVNAFDLEHDVPAVTLPALHGIVLPKAEVSRLQELATLLIDAEEAAGMPRGSVAVMATIETAHGLVEADRIALDPRVVRLGLGEADLAGELGLMPGPGREELWPLRSRIVVASAAGGIAAPVGPVETNVADADQLCRSTRLLLRQGFRARTAIHPAQVSVINSAFSPSAEEIQSAHEVLDRLKAARAQGLGVAQTSDGQFIDEAVARKSREVLARSAW